MFVLKRRTTREAIVDAAYALWSRKPEAGFTELSKEAGVGRATLYRYFASREELMDAITLKALRDMESATAEIVKRADNVKEAIQLLIGKVLPLYDKYRFLSMDIYEQIDPQVLRLMDQQNGEMLELIDMAKQEGLIEASIPSNWVVDVLNNLVYSGWQAVREGYLTVKQAEKMVFNTFMNGIGRPC